MRYSIKSLWWVTKCRTKFLHTTPFCLPLHNSQQILSFSFHFLFSGILLECRKKRYYYSSWSSKFQSRYSIKSLWWVTKCRTKFLHTTPFCLPCTIHSKFCLSASTFYSVVFRWNAVRNVIIILLEILCVNHFLVTAIHK
jgi:hypothetical protein